MNNHTIDILKKAFPYLDNKNKSSIKIILKAAELDDAIAELNNSDTLSACDASNRTPNSIENILKSKAALRIKIKHNKSLVHYSSHKMKSQSNIKILQ